MKDAGNVVYIIDQFSVRFLETSDFEELPFESQIKNLSQVVENSKEHYRDVPVYTIEDVPAFVKSYFILFYFISFLHFHFPISFFFSFLFFSFSSFLSLQAMGWSKYSCSDGLTVLNTLSLK